MDDPMQVSESAIPSIETQREYYDQRWSEWSSDQNAWGLQRAEAVCSYLSSLKRTDLRILDLGCGRGWLSAVLSKWGTVTGVDLSPEGVRLAALDYPHVTFHALDMTRDPLPVGPYDVIVCSEVIEHLEDPKLIFDIAHAALVPSGHLILTTPNKPIADQWFKRKTSGAQPIENYLDFAHLVAAARNEFEVLARATVVPGKGEDLLTRMLWRSPLRRIVGLLGLELALRKMLLWLNRGLYQVLLMRRTQVA